MIDTPSLSLPLLAAAQAQKHVTHNEALLALDSLVQASAKERRAAPPGSPGEGDRYLVAGPASGAFAGREDRLARFEDGAWRFFAPGAGWIVWVEAESRVLVFDGTVWRDPPARTAETFGVSAAADADNRLAVASENVLFSHGGADMRLKLNKASAAATASVLLQSNWSGRAEIGLAGADDLSVKVSADGAAWKQALVIGRSDGLTRFPEGIAHAASGQPAALFIPSPVREIWRLDTSRPAMPRSFAIAGASGTTLTLAAAQAGLIFHTNMRDNAAIRVWNVSKTPAQAAWIDRDLSSTALRVTDAAHIAGWTSGETLRLGDPNPTGGNTLQMAALDIGGYLLHQLGTVFPQKGVFLQLQATSSDGSAALNVSGTGAVNTAVGASAHSNGVRNAMSLPLMTPTPSPISNSNLVFLREDTGFGATDLTICLARVLGVWG